MIEFPKLFTRVTAMKSARVKLFTFFLIMIIASVHCRPPKSRFTNLKCTSYDPAFSKFNKCKLNLLQRGVVAVDINISLFKVPINNIQINWSVWRRYSSYQPFLHNSTCNLCQLLARPNKLTVESMILSAIMSKSNFNHTCPINHDIIVDNLVYNDDFLQKLPLPQADYKIQLLFATNKKWKLMVEIFLMRFE